MNPWQNTIQTISETEQWLRRRERWEPRPEQTPPAGDWRTFLFLAGRGAGKTRAAAEWIHRIAKAPIRIAVVARTAADARDVCVEGESGILRTAPPWARPLYEPSKRRLTWPSGAQATVFSADEPDLLRGPQFHAAWADELAAWNHLEDTWSNLDMALRLGDSPRVFVSTTPRPLPLVKRLMADPRSVVVRGRTIDNTHLPASTIEALQSRYGGTRLGRQELEGEILDDAPGALWRREWIEQARVTEAPALSRVVVAVDPSVTSGEDSDETGIVVCGIGEDGDGYVLADYSRRCTPGEWARQAATAYGLHRADAIVCEVNQGGDLVTESLRQVSRAPVIPVRATRGKQVRAQPLSLRYEQLRVHHVGVHEELEFQLCSWDPLHSSKSPDRLDALVWGFAHLLHLFDDEPPPPERLSPDDAWEAELIKRQEERQRWG